MLTAARDNGLKVGLRLDGPPDWAGGAVYRLDPADVEDYVFHVVRYGAGTIQYVEVFNEMNLPLEWGTSPVDPSAYAQILAGAYRGAKRADPNVIVVSAAPSQRTGGLGGTMEDVDWLNGLYDAGGAARRVMITELGTLEQTSVDLGPYAWMELPTDTRADYLVQALHMASTAYPWLMGATIFNLDYASLGTLPQTSERVWFSLLNPDKSPRPAYTRIRQARTSGYLPG